jgi:hypothetical protein
MAATGEPLNTTYAPNQPKPTDWRKPETRQRFSNGANSLAADFNNSSAKIKRASPAIAEAALTTPFWNINVLESALGGLTD